MKNTTQNNIQGLDPLAQRILHHWALTKGYVNHDLHGPSAL